ncbi:MAG: DUF6293 family protein [Thermoplasmata archaeon]
MERLVHIIPLGLELDRAVLPVRAMKAHRAYVLCNPESHPLQRHFLDRVSEELAGDGVEVIHTKVDTHSDLKALMQEATRIIQDEVKKGNRVYINISSAGKLAAVAGMLAAMAHLGERGYAYYVRPEDYVKSEESMKRYGMSKGMVGNPIAIPSFGLSLPSSAGASVLGGLASSPKKSLSYQDLFDLLRKDGIPGFETKVTKMTLRTEKTRLTVRLTKSILKPLMEAGYIHIEKAGRRRKVILTQSGYDMASLLGPRR